MKRGPILVALSVVALTVGVAAVSSAVDSASGSVKLEWNTRGLSSIYFQNREYLAFGEFNLSRVNLVVDGQAQLAPLKAIVKVDPLHQTMTSIYPWSSIETRLFVNANQLEIRISITNTSKANIEGLSFEPLRLRLDSQPIQYDGSIPIIADNVVKPGILVLSTKDESLVLSNDDPATPLSIGFPWAIDKPANTEFPLRIVTGHEPMYPDMTPFIRRPIAPGQTDVYQLSLSFGDSQHSVNEVGLAIYKRLAAIYPVAVKWPDRRPIGAIMLATADAGFPGNPRGWFLDRGLDISNDHGRARFRATLMEWADQSIAILHDMGAQGSITWDIEGEQYPHPSTYVGDPRLIDSLDPEMAICVDEYFKRFHDAGLKVGLTIRPQQFIRSADGRAATQQEVVNPVQLLNDKISYAKRRWDATLFYIDSNGDPNYPMDAKILRAVAIANPDVLLIPEHSSLLYYGFSAPYGEVRRGVTGTSPLARDLYPTAFRIINTADGLEPGKLQSIQESIGHGDVLMFRTWFHDPANDVVRGLLNGIKARRN